MLVLFEWWPLQRLACTPRTGLPTARVLAGSLREKWPMLALAAAASVITYRVQASTGAVAASDALPFGVRAANAVDALRAYLADVVWPQGLAAFYPHPTSIESPAAFRVAEAGRAPLPDSRAPRLFDTSGESDRTLGEEPFAMSATGVDVFDTTIQKTNRWLDDLMTVLGTRDRYEAYQALRVTLQTLRDRLTSQLNELLAPGALAEDRLAQEVALLAARADVREELDRLGAHVHEARALLKSGDAVGRKLDFLAQEFNREANTLCSKSADIQLTRTGLALKAAIDQFREQAQNVE